MARIDFMFYDDGTGNVAFGNSLEEDQREERDAGGDGNIVSHVVFETNDRCQQVALDAIIAIHGLELEGTSGVGGTTVEHLMSCIFKAGMQYGATKDVMIEVSVFDDKHGGVRFRVLNAGDL